MKVLVTGGRDYSDRDAVWGALDALRADHGPLTVIEGGASGADMLAREWWNLAQVGDWAEGTAELITVRADWNKHGKAAGPIRNQMMLDRYKPDLVLAFPGGRGTADMCKRARAAGVPVREVG